MCKFLGRFFLIFTFTLSLNFKNFWIFFWISKIPQIFSEFQKFLNFFLNFKNLWELCWIFGFLEICFKIAQSFENFKCCYLWVFGCLRFLFLAHGIWLWLKIDETFPVFYKILSDSGWSSFRILQECSHFTLKKCSHNLG